MSDTHLTPKQAQVVRFIAGYFVDHCEWPTLREIMAKFDIRSPNGAVCHLKALRAKGWLATVTDDASQARNTKLQGIETADNPKQFAIDVSTIAGTFLEVSA